MNKDRSYEQYEPNEPAGDRDKGQKGGLYPAARPSRSAVQPGWSADSWEQPLEEERSYTQRTWDEEDYLPNDPAPEGLAGSSYTAVTSEEGAQPNPYTRPTWDEADYLPNEPEPAPAPAPAYNGYRGRHRSSAPRAYTPDNVPIYDTSSKYTAVPPAESAFEPVSPAEEPQPKKLQVVEPPSTDQSEPQAETPPRNPYARPTSDATNSAAWSERFAPPLKFETPDSLFEDIPPEPEYSRPSPNVYRTRKPAVSDSALPPASAAYRVEAEKHTVANKRRKRRALKRWLIVLLILAVLAAGVYIFRDQVLTQLSILLGEETVQSVIQTAVPSQNNPTVTMPAFDAATALEVTSKAQKGIDAVAGDLPLEPYAVTNSNVIQRQFLAADDYDYYLFSALDGKLLGYYDHLPADGFLVCPDDIYYIAMSPWLIDAEGKPLIDTSRYAQAVGKDPVLSPMVNGWALISDTSQTTFNYVDESSTVLSTLWFAKAYPFTAENTIAYVDTGNVTDTDERYTLYELSQDGTMKLWRHTADMSDVLGCAAGIACMRNGELIALDGEQTVLYTSDDVTVYADCGAVVVRDAQTGLYGLYVNGELNYDFAYDSIAPIQSTRAVWRQETNGIYKQYTVSGMAYPQPLSHYFQLTKGDETETVALATDSVYPLVLSLQK